MGRWPYPYWPQKINGKIPELHHLCPNKRCCNPVHVELVTRVEHRALDNKTSCHRGHEFTPENTYIWTCYGKPTRGCVTCKQIRTQEKNLMYRTIPTLKAKKLAKAREYRKRPGVLEHQRAYQREWKRKNRERLRQKERERFADPAFRAMYNARKRHERKLKRERLELGV